VVSANRIGGTLSTDFGKLTNLRHLDLSANGLHGTLPKSMGKMKSLEVLYLGESGLEQKMGLEAGAYTRPLFIST
jgi:Leucine-rich repeat (LRR) protein